MYVRKNWNVSGNTGLYPGFPDTGATLTSGLILISAFVVKQWHEYCKTMNEYASLNL
jgi:hypothetical protein